MVPAHKQNVALRVFDNTGLFISLCIKGFYFFSHYLELFRWVLGRPFEPMPIVQCNRVLSQKGRQLADILRTAYRGFNC